jgi:hypothetical protein
MCYIPRRAGSPARQRNQGPIMADKTDDEILSVQIANQFINVANARMHDGISADDIALGMRHAAANFSAFAFTSHPNAGDPNVLVEEFVRFLEYYLSRHKGHEPPATGLQQLVARVKSES